MAGAGAVARAERNNNPGNIERGAKWQGLMPSKEMSPAQAAESRFAVFRSPAWGFRAMATTLITYQDKRRAPDGSMIDTVRDIIKRWAPPVENNTDSYVTAVCQRTGFAPEQPLNLHRFEHLAPLVKAIAIHECGGWVFRDGDLEEGLKMAGVTGQDMPRAAKKPLQAGAVGMGAEGLRQVLDQTQEQLMMTGAEFQWIKFALGAIALASFALAVWRIYAGWQRQTGS